MALLRIVRDSGYADLLRAYQVIVDGREVGEVRDGETKEFPVAGGTHQLRLKIDWCGSKTVSFTVSEMETAIFQAKSNLRGGKLFAALRFVLFDRDSYLLLEPGLDQSRKHVASLTSPPWMISIRKDTVTGVRFDVKIFV
jgi:hypothetical protein